MFSMILLFFSSASVSCEWIVNFVSITLAMLSLFLKVELADGGIFEV